jgi:ribosomal protein S18 acetylase RimI-like enzyme
MTIQNNIKIRKVLTKDIPNIVNLHRKVVTVSNGKLYEPKVIEEWVSQITQDGVKNQLKKKATSWYLLELGINVIAFCQFPIAKKIIYQLNVDPDYQGKGFGKMLYDFMESKFKETDTDVIELNATLNARAFYEHLGFKVTQPIKYKIIDTEMDMFEMTKSLK